MLLYWGFYVKKRFGRKIEKEDADQDIGVSSVGRHPLRR
jgi:positive regulator of sigma E activity